MNKNNLKYLISLLFVTFFQASLTHAENVKFDNPAGGFLIDLTNFKIPNTFAGLLTYIIQLSLSIVGLLSVVFIIFGGFQYITARGNEEQAEGGKKTLTNAIIGLVIVILSYMIVAVVANAAFGKVK